MLKRIIAQLMESPELVQKLENGKLNLDGLNETEKEALLDVFGSGEAQTVDVQMCYWK
ncbi:competence pheromone ComX [Halobacillus litoralis]|uniref:competence pheromone ComX n=1 Tax=Halobacillus litoralis TaxID=45668 RepID=UPI001CD3A12F|nr:competence pheromone ComX [Halobacillus litoralis]MCA0971396.1 competence pheromone ComX [Halobacillus litoralis]